MTQLRARAGVKAWLARGAAGLAAFVVTTSGAAPLQDPALRTRMEILDREVSRLSDELSRFVGEEEGVLARLEQLSAEARLQDAKLERAGLGATEADAGLAQAEEALAEVSHEVVASRAAFRSSVRLMHMLGPSAGLRLLVESARADKVADALRLAHALGERWHTQLAALGAKIAELEQLRRSRRAQATRLAQARERVAATRDALTRAIEQRSDLLARLGKEREMRERALLELHRAREELTTRIADGEPLSAIDSSLDVTRFRGVLGLPATGRVSAPFGPRKDPRLGTVIPHPGWDIEAPFGTHVRAPFGGRVAWSGWLRGYGLVTIVDHGRGVHTVYAHLSALLVEAGQEIASGQVFASVGDTGSLHGPFLYLEVREAGKAVDPAVWFSAVRH